MERSQALPEHTAMPAKKPIRPAPAFLRKWRLYRCLTLEQVGNIVGVGFQAVHKWEVGKTPVDIETLKLLASAYNTTVAGLMGDPADPVMSERAQQAIAILKSLPSDKAEVWLQTGLAMAPAKPPEK